MGGGGEVGVVGGSLISTLKNFTMSFGACAKNCKRDKILTHVIPNGFDYVCVKMDSLDH